MVKSSFSNRFARWVEVGVSITNTSCTCTYVPLDDQEVPRQAFVPPDIENRRLFEKLTTTKVRHLP